MDIARPDLKKRRRNRRNITIGGLGAALLVATTAAITLGNAAPAVPSSDVLIDAVQRGDFVQSVRGPGRLIPSQSRWAVARTDARVEKIVVQPGSDVSADTVVLELSNPQVEAEALSAVAEYSAAESDRTALEARLKDELLALESEVAEIQGSFESAKVQEAASRRAFEMGVMAQIEHQRIFITMSQLENRLQLAKQRVAQFKSGMGAQIGASDTRLEQLRHQRDLRQEEADSLNVRAGLKGVLQQIDVEEGQQVASGVNLARTVRPEDLIAELLVPESQAAQLAPGQTSTLNVGRVAVEGTVRRVNPSIQNGAVRVEVAIDSALPQGSRAEQSIDGSIVLGEVPDTLHVARPANLIPNAPNSVYKLTDRSTAVRVDAIFGVDSMTRVQVTGGLQAGDRIILSDMSRFQGAERLQLD